MGETTADGAAVVVEGSPLGRALGEGLGPVETEWVVAEAGAGLGRVESADGIGAVELKGGGADGDVPPDEIVGAGTGATDLTRVSTARDGVASSRRRRSPVVLVVRTEAGNAVESHPRLCSSFALGKAEIQGHVGSAESWDSRAGVSTASARGYIQRAGER